MKIRTRLSLWYFFVTLLILLFLNLGVFLGMRNLLYEAIDEDLNRFADVIEKSYNPIIGQFEELIWKFDSYKRYQELYIVVYNSASRPVFASPMIQYFKLDIPFSQNPEQEGHTVHSVFLEDIPYISPGVKTEVTFRAISRRMTYRGYNIGWIQAALPINNTENQLRNLLRVMIISNLVAVLLLAFGGYFLVRKLLNPVQIISEKAQHISHSNLNERIKVNNPNDELGQLSQTLNELLNRLQLAFLSQKQFVADAAHELKTPLAILRSHLEAEINNPALDDDFKVKLNNDLETIARMTHLINNLLLLAKSEAVQDERDFSKVELKALILDVLEDIEMLGARQEQTVSSDLPSEITIMGNRDQLYRLLFNLLENAVKYSPPKAKIKISLAEVENQVRIIVEDNGPGIANKYLTHIFDRFYRIDKARSRRKGGSGLGLSIVKMITDLHKGTIEIKSRENEGTVFVLYFPINEDNGKRRRETGGKEKVGRVSDSTKWPDS